VPSTNTHVIPLVYILAASHSGSTLLAMLLGGHPDVCTVGELKANALGPPDHYRCSCGRYLVQCPFWAEVQAAVSARGFTFDIFRAGTDVRTGATPYRKRLLRPLHRGPALEWLRDAALSCSPGWRAHLARVDALNAALAQAVCDLTGSRVIVDSSKIGLRLKYLLRSRAFDVKVLRLIRDGRAVALTYMDPERFADAANPALRGGGTGRDRESERLSMTAAAHEWRRSNEEAEALVSRLPPDKVLQLHYEELCASPAQTVGKALSFIGVDAAAAGADFRARDHHVLGNGMRLDTVSEVRLDDRWRRQLDADALRAFDAVAGDLNRSLGYA
jgi:Sulfotransferase family